MYIAVVHHIVDKVQWAAAALDVMTHLPSGARPVFYIPSRDLSKAVCVWQTDSPEAVKKYLEAKTTAFCRNEYYIVDETSSVGLENA